MTSLFPLRPLQQKALDGLKASLRSGHRRPIIQGPTGFGKTIVAAHIVHGAMGKRKKVAFVVPMLSLIDQTFERFMANGIDAQDMGVVQGNHPWRRPDAPIQICSVQTLASRGCPEVDFVVIDEVHIRHKIVEDWIKADPHKIFVGLSATPWSRGLADHWDDLVIPTSIEELIDEGHLSPFKVFCPSHPDLAGIKNVAGDYHEGQLSERMSKASIVADVVDTWLTKAERRPTLVFAVDRAHAAALHQQFADEGVQTAYVDANTPREERAELGRQLETGHLEVICSIGVMTTGVDLDVRCIVIARPTRSEILHVQVIGRGLRTAKGKDDLLILDHSDNHLRLGMVTDIHHDKLLGGKNERAGPEERKVPLPRECKQCACVIPPRAPECPNCGYVHKRENTVATIAGELVEFDRNAKRIKNKTNRELTWEEKAAFFGELKGYAQMYGYKNGWAAQKYKAKTGVFPNDPRVRDSRARPPSMGTRSWIKSEIIRWAKSQHKRSDDQIIRDSVTETRGLP